MAHQLLQCRLGIGGSSFVGHVSSVSATHSQEEIDDTVFVDTFKNWIAGLQEYENAIGLRDDVADNLVDELVFALWAANTSGPGVAVAWGYNIATLGTSTASDPEYQYTGLLLSDQAGGGVGEGANRSLSLKIASGTITRDIT